MSPWKESTITRKSIVVYSHFRMVYSDLRRVLAQPKMTPGFMRHLVSGPTIVLLKILIYKLYISYSYVEGS